MCVECVVYVRESEPSLGLRRRLSLSLMPPPAAKPGDQNFQCVRQQQWVARLDLTLDALSLFLSLRLSSLAFFPIASAAFFYGHSMFMSK